VKSSQRSNHTLFGPKQPEDFGRWANVLLMDPTEIVKAAPTIVKSAVAAGAAIPFTSIGKRMLGPAADEVAEMWRDKVKLYRYEKQLGCLKKAEEMGRRAGFVPSPVPPKVLFPLLKGASFEEDDDLHSMWAALLANASSPSSADKVRPGYIALLRQLASDEAALLNWLYRDHVRQTEEKPRTQAYWYEKQLTQAYIELFKDMEGRNFNDLAASIFALEAAFLIERHAVEVDGQVMNKMNLTVRGWFFVEACTAPAVAS